MDNSHITHEDKWREILSGICLLGAFGFISANLGHISAQLNQVAALLLLAVFTALECPPLGSWMRQAHARSKILTGGLIFTAIAGWVLGGEVERSCAVVLFLCALEGISQAVNSPRPRLRAFSLTASLIALYLLILKHAFWIWAPLQDGSRWMAHSLSHTIGQHLHLGATASGIHVFVFFLIYVGCTVYISRRWAWRTLGSVVGLGAAVYVLYLLLHSSLFVPLLTQFENPYHLGHSHYRAYMITSLNTPAFLLGLLAIPLLFLVRTRVEPRHVAAKPRWTHLAIGGSAALLGAIAITALPVPAPSRGDVVLYDKGYLNWNRPVTGEYGERSAGMFGILPEFIRAAGFTVRRESEISNRTLHGCSTLVVINLQKSFTPEEHEAVWRFVSQGGSLLALGDHTGLAGIREPFNDLLKPVGIELNFDSAHYISDWDHAFETFPHPVTQGVPERREIGISVGASLKVPASAVPVVTAQYGFSDIGNANNADGAFLGDRRYNQGEPLAGC